MVDGPTMNGTFIDSHRWLHWFLGADELSIIADKERFRDASGDFVNPETQQRWPAGRSEGFPHVSPCGLFYPWAQWDGGPARFNKCSGGAGRGGKIHQKKTHKLRCTVATESNRS